MNSTILFKSENPTRINPFLIMREAEKLFNVPPGSIVGTSRSFKFRDCKAAACYVTRALTDWPLLEICDHFEITTDSMNHRIYRVRDSLLKNPESDLSIKTKALLFIFRGSL